MVSRAHACKCTNYQCYESSNNNTYNNSGALKHCSHQVNYFLELPLCRSYAPKYSIVLYLLHHEHLHGVPYDSNRKYGKYICDQQDQPHNDHEHRAIRCPLLEIKHRQIHVELCLDSISVNELVHVFFHMEWIVACGIDGISVERLHRCTAASLLIDLPIRVLIFAYVRLFYL